MKKKKKIIIIIINYYQQKIIAFLIGRMYFTGIDGFQNMFIIWHNNLTYQSLKTWVLNISLVGNQTEYIILNL